MATTQLDKAQWEEFFDRVSRQLVGRPAEIEVAGMDVGDQIEAEFIPMTGITYDPKDDLIEVASDEVDHIIRQPRQVWVDLGVDGLHSVEIVDADDHRQIVKLVQPLELPPPA